MKVLVACEESQRVCIEFRRLGHEACSCDIELCSGGHEEWHIQNDVLPLLNGNCKFQTVDGVAHKIDGKWDMIIAFPPCTYLSNAGARHLWKGHKLNQDRYKRGLQAKKLFMAIYEADCKRIALENPTPSRIYELPEKSQVIQPYQFGHPYTKRTQLWLKGLPLLEPTKIVEPTATWCPSGSYSHKHGEKHRGMFTTDRARNRAKTFPGIAKAMAEQWGRLNMSYTVYSDFNAEQHKQTFIHYLEVVIDENGKIMYAVPSHQEKMIKLACEKLNVARDKLNEMCPEEYYFEFMTWLSKVSGACAVWENQVIGDKFTEEQIKVLQMLKDEGLYLGEIPRMEVGLE